MPVTKTAKRALRSSKKKLSINKIIISTLEVAMREAKRSKDKEAIQIAISLADRAAKKNTIHKNKANRIKSTLMNLLPKKKTASKVAAKTTAKVAPKATKKVKKSSK